MYIKNKISSIIFFLLFSFYIIGLYTNFNSLFLNNLIFWISIVGMLTLIFYQIFNLEDKIEYLLLVELFMLYMGLHLLCIIGYHGLNGIDSYSDYNFFKSILVTGHFTLGGVISGWPILHIFTTACTLIGNLEPLTIAKFLPLIISSLIVFPLYILVNSVYKNKKVALLACLIFGTTTQFIEFEGGFVREIIGLFFIVLLFYILYNSKREHNQGSFILLFLLFVPLMVFNHHFSSFMFLILLIIVVTMNQLIPLIYKNKDFINLKDKNINTIFLIFMVTLLAYWVYSVTIVWVNIGDFINGILGINEVQSYIQQSGEGGSIVSLRGNILYYGFFAFNIILVSILLLKMLIDKNREKIEDWTFTIFLLFCGSYGIIATFFISASIFPQRLLTFGWIFGVMPLAGFILTLERLDKKNLKIFIIPLKSLTKPKIGNYRVVNVLFVLLTFSFMIFNIYNIDPNYIGKNYDTMGVTGGTEYAIADTLKFNSSYTNSNTSEIYFAYGSVAGAIFDKQGLDPHINELDFSEIAEYYPNFSETNQLAIINENIFLQYLDYQKIKSIKDYNNNMLLLSYKNSPNIDKICDVGNNIYVLKGTG